MIDSGLLDENDNGHGNDNDHNSDDMFDGIIDILDFSMEDMVIDGEVEELQGESSPLGDLSALPCPFTSNSCNDLQTPVGQHPGVLFEEELLPMNIPEGETEIHLQNGSLENFGLDEPVHQPIPIPPLVELKEDEGRRVHMLKKLNPHKLDDSELLIRKFPVHQFHYDHGGRKSVHI